MIIGRVTAGLEIVATMGIVAAPDSTIEVDAIVDTGFNGTVAIPKSLADQLGLKSIGSNEATLADGRVATLEFCYLTIEWAASRREVAAWIIERGCLVGMELLFGFRLDVDVIPGGDVILKAK